MDTSEHLRVARKALAAYSAGGSEFPDLATAVVSLLRFNCLLREPGSDDCTRAERELIEADIKGAEQGWDKTGWYEAKQAVLAERASAPATAPEPADRAPNKAGKSVLSEDARQAAKDLGRADALLLAEQSMRDMAARITSLESALAEERAKPKEGALRSRVYGSGATWTAEEDCLKWAAGPRVTFTNTAHPYLAEGCAREHAAKLTAEQGGVA